MCEEDRDTACNNEESEEKKAGDWSGAEYGCQKVGIHLREATPPEKTADIFCTGLCIGTHMLAP